MIAWRNRRAGMRLSRLTSPFSSPPTSSRKMTCATRGGSRPALVISSGMGSDDYFLERPVQRTCIWLCDRASKTRPLTQASRDVRPDPVGERQRQALPQLDEQAVFRIERIQLGYALASDQPVLVVQGLRLESPVFLEVERAGTTF